MAESSERVTQELLKIINGTLNVQVESIEPDQRLDEDLRLDSLDLVRLAMECEDEFDITIDDRVWGECRTLQQVNALVVKLVREKDEDSD